jgi:hypothetical protein
MDTIEYLGRYFSPVASFPLNVRKDAEQRCVKSSEFGVMSLLVEFTDSLVLCCEGLAIQPEPLLELQPEALPVQPRTLTYRGAPVRQQQASPSEVSIAQSLAVHREIRYRGVVVKQPEIASNGSSESFAQSQPAQKELAANL